VSAERPIFILDSFAVLAYLAGEPGMSRVQEVLEAAVRGEHRTGLSWINLGEVLYITEREVGLAQAQAVLAAIEQLPIQFLDVTKERVLAAAHIKANYRVAYADAFAIAAAKELGGTVLTGDPEYESITALVPVEWIDAR
jgi:predicted nucleic acid-binding protein